MEHFSSAEAPLPSRMDESRDRDSITVDEPLRRRSSKVTQVLMRNVARCLGSTGSPVAVLSERAPEASASSTLTDMRLLMRGRQRKAFHRGPPQLKNGGGTQIFTGGGERLRRGPRWEAEALRFSHKGGQHEGLHASGRGCSTPVNHRTTTRYCNGSGCWSHGPLPQHLPVAKRMPVAPLQRLRVFCRASTG